MQGRRSVDALDAEAGFPLHSCEFRNRFITGVLPLTHGVMKCFAEVCKVSVIRRTSILLLVAPAVLLLPVAAVRAGSAQDEATPQHAKTTTTSGTASKAASKSTTSKGASSKTTSTTKTSATAKKTSSRGACAHRFFEEHA